MLSQKMVILVVWSTYIFSALIFRQNVRKWTPTIAPYWVGPIYKISPKKENPKRNKLNKKKRLTFVFRNPVYQRNYEL